MFLPYCYINVREWKFLATVPAWDPFFFFFFWLNQSSDTLRSADCRFFVLIQTQMILLATTWTKSNIASVTSSRSITVRTQSKKNVCVSFLKQHQGFGLFLSRILDIEVCFLRISNITKIIQKNNNSIYSQNIHREQCSF